MVVGERLRLEHNDPTILYSGPWNVLAHPEFSAGQARISEGSGARFLEVVFRGNAGYAGSHATITTPSKWTSA